MNTQDKAQHTPGPWGAAQNTPGICIPGTEGLYCVERIRHSGRDTLRETLAENCTPEDACLMAAAPELLAALQELCADKYLADPINADRMSNARAAIAKAKGGAA